MKYVKYIIILVFLILAVIGGFQTCTKEDDGKCGMCNGSGYYQKKTCPACDGSGYSDFDPEDLYNDIYG